MLKPSMNELMAKVNNRYLLVNLAAQRARDLADESEETGEKLPDKAVKLALDEIADGSIVYRDGPRVVPEPAPDLDADVNMDTDMTANADINMDMGGEPLVSDTAGGEAETVPPAEFAAAFESPAAEAF